MERDAIDIAGRVVRVVADNAEALVAMPSHNHALLEDGARQHNVIEKQREPRTCIKRCRLQGLGVTLRQRYQHMESNQVGTPVTDQTLRWKYCDDVSPSTLFTSGVACVLQPRTRALWAKPRRRLHAFLDLKKLHGLCHMEVWNTEAEKATDTCAINVKDAHVRQCSVQGVCVQ